MSHENSLPNILSSKNYPQVLRVTRPYYAHGREYLKKGQYITVLDRRKVELITGLDYDRRAFHIRKDRSVHIEVVEEERIVYNLANVAEIEKHVNSIELRKEIRFEKQAFGIGEKFTIEKVGKNFRGRSKNVELRRKKDGKIYRFPLDIIGTFKLHTGKSVLPISKVLTLRTTPITARFPHTTMSNFPTGVVTLGDSTLVDIVYILTVRQDLYQYEVMTLDTNIYVEKCNISIPNPILEIIPNGIFVNSAEYMQSIKGRYKKLLSTIDSKLIEDIYSQDYYGSASFEKNNNEDLHLIDKPRLLSSTKSCDDSQTDRKKIHPVSVQSQSPSVEDPPAPFPRYSKKSQYRNTIQFPAIREYERLDKKMEEFHQELSISKPQQTTVGKTTAESGTSMNDTLGRKCIVAYERNSVHLLSDDVSIPTTSLSGSVRSRGSSYNSIRSISSDHNERQGIAESAAKLFYNPHNGPPVMTRHSRSSSNATEDSFDSGVVLTHTANSVFNSALNSPTEEKHPLYAQPIKQGDSNVRLITMPPPAANILTTPHTTTTQHDTTTKTNVINNSYSTNIAVQPAFSTQTPLQPAFSTQTPLQPVFSTHTPLQPAFSSQTALQPAFSTQTSLKPVFSTHTPKQPSFATTPAPPLPPLPPRDSIYQNIHHIQVEIDINEAQQNTDYDDIRTIQQAKNTRPATASVGYQDQTSTTNKADRTNANLNSGINTMHIRENTYEELPYENTQRLFDFRSQSINEPLRRKSGKAIAKHLSKHFAEEAKSTHSKLELKPPRTQEIQYLSQQEISDLLASLNLGSFIQTFHQELINGQLLCELDEQTLVNDLRMSQFQARKLYKYVHGWRPIQHDMNGNDVMSSSPNPAFWSVGNVIAELHNIHLQGLALFCEENQIDGALLTDLVQSNIISSLRSEHGVSINGIEMSRLKAFILKEWRPDSLTRSNSNDKNIIPERLNSLKKERPEKKVKPLWNKLISS